MTNLKAPINMKTNSENDQYKDLSLFEVSQFITNPIAIFVTQRKFSFIIGQLFGLNGMFAFFRRSAKHGVHHEMRSPLQAGSTVHHSLIDGGAQVGLICIHVYFQVLYNIYAQNIFFQVGVNILVQNNFHLYLLSLPCMLMEKLGFQFLFFQWIPFVWLLSLPLLSLLQEESNHTTTSILTNKFTKLVLYWSLFGGLCYLGGVYSYFTPLMGSRHPLSRAAHNLLVTWLLCEVFKHIGITSFLFSLIEYNNNQQIN